MPASLTYDDMVQTGRFQILTAPSKFNIAIADTDGSDVNVMLKSSAAMAEEAGAFAQQAYNEVNLSTAIEAGGEVLNRFVWDRYQLVRQDAQGSVATLDFSRTTAASPVTIPAGTVSSTDDGQTFETINEIVMGAGVLGPVSVTAQSQSTGEQTNVDAGAIIQITSGLTDTSLTVINPAVAAGGSPEESDTNLGQRARDFFINSRRGTRQAIQNGCVTTSGVAQATVQEFLSSDNIPNYRTQAIIADVNGQSNAALAARVTDRLEEFRALGVPVQVTAGVPQFVDIVIEGLTFQAGANTTSIIDQIRAQVVARVNELRPQQILQKSLIFNAIQVARLVSIPETSIVTPAGDLVPSGASGVIRTTSSRVSINGQTGGS